MRRSVSRQSLCPSAGIGSHVMGSLSSLLKQRKNDAGAAAVRAAARPCHNCDRGGQIASRRIKIYLRRSLPAQNYSRGAGRERIARQAQQLHPVQPVLVNGRHQRAGALITHRIVMQAEVSEAGAGAQQEGELLCACVGDAVAAKSQLLKLEVAM